MQALSRESTEAAHQVPEAHRYMAEYHHLNGDNTTAVQLLERALTLPGSDFYERSRAQARLEDLRAELADEKERKDQ